MYCSRSDFLVTASAQGRMQMQWCVESRKLHDVRRQVVDVLYALHCAASRRAGDEEEDGAHKGVYA